MDKKSRFPIRKFDSLEAMKDEEYRYWQGRPASERLAAVSEITTEAYRLKDPPAMYPDFKKLLSWLNAHKVKYLVVGGYAVSFHAAQPWATKHLRHSYQGGCR